MYICIALAVRYLLVKNYGFCFFRSTTEFAMAIFIFGEDLEYARGRNTLQHNAIMPPELGTRKSFFGYADLGTRLAIWKNFASVRIFFLDVRFAWKKFSRKICSRDKNAIVF